MNGTRGIEVQGPHDSQTLKAFQSVIMPWHAFSVQDLLATGDLGFRSVAALRQARRITIISECQDRFRVHRERFTCRKKTYDVPTVFNVPCVISVAQCPLFESVV